MLLMHYNVGVHSPLHLAWGFDEDQGIAQAPAHIPNYIQ